MVSWRIWRLAAVTSILLGAAGCSPSQPHPPGERILFSFERRTMLPMLSGTAGRHLVSQHVTHGNRALRLRLASGRETLILDSSGFPMNWSDWRVLRVDVYRPQTPILLHLRVSDAHGRRRWIWSKRVEPGATTLEYSLADLGAEIDLKAVTEIMWYAESPSGELYLDAIRLAHPRTLEEPTEPQPGARRSP